MNSSQQQSPEEFYHIGDIDQFFGRSYHFALHVLGLDQFNGWIDREVILACHECVVRRAGDGNIDSDLESRSCLNISAEILFHIKSMVAQDKDLYRISWRSLPVLRDLVIGSAGK